MTQFNLSCYSGTDYYSDGTVEDRLLELVKAGKTSEEILADNEDFAIYYHLQAKRKNLLDWYPFKESANLLEIGAGCGALTGLLAEKLSQVKAVELSKKRAEILYYRHINYDNLEVLVGNLNDMHFEERFDYITLIGVLEYAGKFTQTADPFLHFLEKIVSLLKPTGHLLLAIENKFGLKYFAGAREDHTGRYFDGIEGYPGQKEIQTFGKQELKDLLQNAGFQHLDFYYPMPDYKFPRIIYSDQYLPNSDEFFEMHSPNFDQSALALFNESAAYAGICKNQQFDFFANSFLVDAQLCK